MEERQKAPHILLAHFRISFLGICALAALTFAAEHCVGFKFASPSAPAAGFGQIPLRLRAAEELPNGYTRTQIRASGGPANAPFNLFSRSAPLKVHLEHREPAAVYTAYGEVGGPLASPMECRGASGSEAEPGDEVYHLVFSYDPSALSGKTQGPFRYLEGQSVSFVNLKDQREGQVQSGAPPPKPRLYSVASSPLCPDKGLQHSFSLCVKRHRYRAPDGRFDPCKDGLCSSLLCTAPIGTEFEVAGPVGASLLLPEDRDAPLIFACTGTGAAPLRSFLRRVFAERRNGPVVAYIGAAKAASTPYAREWEALQQLLPPSQLQLRFAYSREMKAPDGGRLYVQHLMEADGDELLRLFEEGALMYVCGRKDMLPPIKAALQAAAQNNNVDFSSFFKSLIASKRWRAEVY
ncbi:ferredoxin NADP+ oxidoreductase, putative [Eimeria tenella]|uniref:ferredoxin--NADP(+) reductase n=1 Tax=Eimeria tenella TaxID=5802 RepID=U6KWT4_EIMTE|nr:ferredoxin NADP+ oxidoreductase, putative [Eimeria tenella]CDJ39945.1 ferredoxin NADP+ oxidoreductase, putative [Eimeria tenella]|eukprot:XP_013230698.1 ferredoxin NADP+ oxidoreductase, putative [Eimeria tenella]